MNVWCIIWEKEYCTEKRNKGWCGSLFSKFLIRNITTAEVGVVVKLVDLLTKGPPKVALSTIVWIGELHPRLIKHPPNKITICSRKLQQVKYPNWNENSLTLSTLVLIWVNSQPNWNGLNQINQLDLSNHLSWTNYKRTKHGWVHSWVYGLKPSSSLKNT